MDGAGYGKTVQSVVHWVGNLDFDSDSEYVNYPAIPVAPLDQHYVQHYAESVSAGIGALLRHISGFLETCHHSKLYLAGYSQGAQVVGDTYQDWLSDAERARVSKLALLGDPRFKGVSSRFGGECWASCRAVVPPLPASGRT